MHNKYRATSLASCCLSGTNVSITVLVSAKHSGKESLGDDYVHLSVCLSVRLSVTNIKSSLLF